MEDTQTNDREAVSEPKLTEETAQIILTEMRNTVTNIYNEIFDCLSCAYEAVCESGYEPLTSFYDDMARSLTEFSCSGGMGMTYDSVLSPDASDDEHRIAQNLDNNIINIINSISRLGDDIPMTYNRSALNISDGLFDDIESRLEYFFNISYYAPACIEASIPDQFLAPANDYLTGMITEISYYSEPAYNDLRRAQELFSKAKSIISSAYSARGHSVSTSSLKWTY